MTLGQERQPEGGHSNVEGEIGAGDAPNQPPASSGGPPTSPQKPPRPPLPPQLLPQQPSQQQQQPQQQQPSPQRHQVLLNNFQIKKKRYRVLLHNQTLVWERLTTPSADYGSIGDSQQGGNNKAEVASGAAAANRKETEYETERLAQKAAYGSASHVVHINEIIRVDKSASKRPNIPPAVQPVFTITSDATLTGQQQQHHSQQQQQQQPTTSGNSSLTAHEQYLTVHYAERLVRSATNCNRWRVRKLTLYQADVYIVRQWHAELLALLAASSTRCRVRRLLVFINPYGGRQRGLHTYERCCKPLFQLAGIDASCIISQRANQIRDILLGHDLSPFDAVCCVGGDGTVAEVINGLVMRAMLDEGLDTSRPAYVPRPRLPIGVIPAGSTDTVAYSLHGTEDALTAAIHVVLGQRRGLDVCSVRNASGLVRFCASVFSYGYLGDVAAKSERYRWMGTKRYEFTGARAFVLNRGYEAELRLLLPEKATGEALNVEGEDNNAQLEVEEDLTTCYSSCLRCAAAQPEHTMAQQNNEKCDRGSENKDVNCDNENSKAEPDVVTTTQGRRLDKAEQQQQQKHVNLLKENETKEEKIAEQPKEEPIKDNDNSRWKVVKGKFFMISGANITCACSRSPNGISRYNHLGDGCLELILVRRTSLWNNVRLLLNTMGHTGDIRSLPFVEVYRTKCFSFRVPNALAGGADYDSVRGSCQPIVEHAVGAAAETARSANTSDALSSWNCDGEVVTDLDVMMSSHCQLVDVFMRGPFAYSKPLKGGNNNANSIAKCCCKTED